MATTSAAGCELEVGANLWLRRWRCLVRWSVSFLPPMRMLLLTAVSGCDTVLLEILLSDVAFALRKLTADADSNIFCGNEDKTLR
jgi:hypothetical protein